MTGSYLTLIAALAALAGATWLLVSVHRAWHPNARQPSGATPTKPETEVKG